LGWRSSRSAPRSRSTRWWRSLADTLPEQAAQNLTAEDVRHAARAGAGIVKETPVLSSGTLSSRSGATVALKTENLQRTGSFKIRGALAKLAALGDGCAEGVVTASAGNHGQALAYAARVRGVSCEVFMPETAPIAKVEAARSMGATIHLTGASLDESLAAAFERAETGHLAFVHPFDDPDVVAGQGSVGLELLTQVPDLAAVLVPVGGGGLASGIAIATKSARPEIRVIGVQVETCAPFPASLEAGEPVPAKSALTIADGIAVKRPGGLTLQLVKRWVDEIVLVGEDDVGEAMVFLLERTKLVVEGAGAVGVAALLSGLELPAEGTSVVILSGGNVDAGLLAQIVRRHESQAGRRLVLLARVPDRPGSLAGLLSLVAEQRANLLDVIHIREGLDLHVRETAVQLVLETRGQEHAERVSRAIREAGYAEPRAVE
jgi:threonine dehydratase